MSSNGGVAIHYYRFVLFWTFLASVVCHSGSNSTENPFARLKVMMAKLEFLGNKLLVMELRLSERDEEFADKFTKLEDLIETHSRKILAKQTVCANHEKMRNEISQLTQKLSQPYIQMLHSLPDSRSKGPFTSCMEAPEHVSGVYSIKLSEDAYPFEAYCEQNSHGGGWLVMQYRFDGSLDFYRTWTEYRDGFGSPYHEYWLGLERLYQLTSQGPYELLVELKTFNGSYSYAHYNEFQIGSESEKYVLKKARSFSGTAEDAMERHQGMKFSTKERDNDIYSGNCAVERGGAWWYADCSDSNLNGRYVNSNDTKSMHFSKPSFQGFAFSRMMIRPN